MRDRPKWFSHLMYFAIVTFNARLILNVIIVHLTFLIVLTINENILVPIMLYRDSSL